MSEQTTEAEPTRKVIGDAQVVEPGVVQYHVGAYSEDGTTTGDTFDTVGIESFMKLGFKLQGALVNEGDTAVILG
jgi:hypothetical protein